MIAAALTAAAALYALPFAPPLDRPLRYETVQERTIGGKAQRFTMVNELRFTRARGERGYQLTITLVDIASDAAPSFAAPYEAGMRPFVGIAETVELDPDGTPTDVLNAEATWSRVLGALDAMAATLAARNADTERLAALRRTLSALRALPPEAQRAKLAADAGALVGMRPPPAPLGTALSYSEQGAAAARNGTIALVTLDGERARYAIDAAGGTVHEHRDLAYSRTTGLLLSAIRSDAAQSDPAAPLLLRETIRQLPSF